MSVPLVCDEGHLKQGGDVEHADEESDGDGVHLAEEEDEGGGKGANQGEQEEFKRDYQNSCKIRIFLFPVRISYVVLPMSLKSAANTLMSEVTYGQTGHSYYYDC